MKKAAHVVLENKRHEVLLILRDDKLSIPFPDYWDLIGGKIEEGETPEEAAIRETEEEVGHRLQSIQFFHEYDEKDSEMGEGEFELHVFTSPHTVSLEELTLGNEGQKIQFFAKDKALQLKLPPIIQKILEDYFTLHE